MENCKTTGQGALRAGAGRGEIVIGADFFPEEGFNGEVHLNPCVRVLVLEADIRTAIVAFEMVAVASDYILPYKRIVSEITGTPVEHIWLHATHAITTPHAPGDATRRAVLDAALTKALTEAANQAAGSFQSAVMGIGTGRCDVNTNGNVCINGEYWVGPNEELPSNKEMTVVRFDTPDGAPIGFLISYGIKPTAIDNAEMGTSTRKVSSDVPGVACRMVEAELGAPALFVMPAAGDQIPKGITIHYIEDENGAAQKIDEGVAYGVEVAERLGAEMGRDAIAVAGSVVCTDRERSIHAGDTAFTWPSISGDGEVKVVVRGITIGDDLAFVGLKCEVNANTERQLWKASPYGHTLLMSFIDGDQKYMPDAQAYDLQTWQWKRSGFARGAAEKFVSTAADLLKNIETAEVAGGAHSAAAAVERKKITLGGHEWIVLEEQADRMLVLSSLVLEQRAYHAPGGDITWEKAELRAYLNGEFIEKTFSAAEQARILKTTIQNRSNSQYGVPGGSDTTDRVFLLSQGDFERYFTGSVEQSRGSLLGTSAYIWWHLRTPGEAAYVNAGVSTIGLLDSHGLVDGVSDPTGGVRPAMWITPD